MTLISDLERGDAERAGQHQPAQEPGELLQIREGRVLLLLLNRPDRLNALTPQLHEQLLDSLRAAASDRSVGAVVLSGQGRAFCSGGDMNRRESTDVATKPTMEDRADGLLHHGESVRLLHQMPKPTIAMINGVAAGAGLALALACDLRFASRDATLTTSYVRVAMSGDLGISYFMTHLVGAAKARELMFLGDKISADDAMEIGLVSQVSDASALYRDTLDVAGRLASGPAVALRYIKQNLVLAQTGSLDQVMEREAFNMARCSRTQDVKEAALAFREKRTPKFTGN